MGVLDDVMKALDRWAEWGPIRAAPAKIEAMEKRLAELEEKLGGKWPADVCRMCGERAARIADNGVTRVGGGLIEELWDCSACKQRDNRTFKG